MDVGKLITYYDYFDIDLDNAVNVKVPEDGQYIDYRARQTRLNHKSFTYSINVTSDSNTDAYVRVFLGPKYDYLGREYNINDRRHYFVEIDRFPYKSKNWNAWCLTGISVPTEGVLVYPREFWTEIFITVS